MKIERKISRDYIYTRLSGSIGITDMDALLKHFRAMRNTGMPVILDMRGVKIMHIRTGNAVSLLRKSLKSAKIPFTVVCTDPYHMSILNFSDYEIFYLVTPDIYSAKHSVMQKVCI